MMKNKKAIEPVIATVLLIVITVAAVALIVAFVVPFVKNQMQGAQLCYNARIDLKSDGVCYALTNTTPGGSNYTFLVLKMGRGAETFDLAGVLISIGGKDKTKTVTTKNATLLPMNPLEETSLSVNVSKLFDVMAEVLVEIKSVAIAPIVKSGTTEKICEPTAQLSMIPECPIGSAEIEDIVKNKIIN